MILESPALPVAEGDDVTLRCRAQTPVSSGLSTFFRDGVPIGRSSTGNLTIHNISRAEGGVYKCTTGAGESPGSQLTVTARGSAPSSESSCCKRETKSSDYGVQLWSRVSVWVRHANLSWLFVCGRGRRSARPPSLPGPASCGGCRWGCAAGRPAVGLLLEQPPRFVFMTFLTSCL